jgi:hypothetical protein
MQPPSASTPGLICQNGRFPLIASMLLDGSDCLNFRLSVKLEVPRRILFIADFFQCPTDDRADLF